MDLKKTGSQYDQNTFHKNFKEVVKMKKEFFKVLL